MCLPCQSKATWSKKCRHSCHGSQEDSPSGVILTSEAVEVSTDASNWPDGTNPSTEPIPAKVMIGNIR